jgi:hypothetical protein
MPDDYNPLLGTSGFKTDFWGEVVRAEWDQKTSGDNSSPFLKLHLYLPDEEDEYDQIYYAPNDWLTTDGQIVVPKSGAKRGKFRIGSGIQNFLTHLMATPCSDYLVAHLADYPDQQGPMHADFYQGLAIFFSDVSVPTRRQKPDSVTPLKPRGEWEEATKTEVLPTDAQPRPTTGAGEPATRSVSSANTVSTPPSNGDLHAALGTLAAKYDTREAWAEAALAELGGSGDVIRAISDEELFASLKVGS